MVATMAIPMTGTRSPPVISVFLSSLTIETYYFPENEGGSRKLKKVEELKTISTWQFQKQ